MIDPIGFLEEYFILESTGKAIVLEDWQKKFLHDLLDDDSITLAVLSATKKTGKSTLAAGVALYILMCWRKPVEILFIANSFTQTQTLAYKTLAYACENHPKLAKSCTVFKAGKIVVDSTGAIARCIPTKAKSVAGAAPSLVVFDEAWGLTEEDEDLWSELTSIPTKRSLTLVASYAGLEGQSPLLERLYELGMSNDKPDDMLFLWSTNPKLSSWVTDRYLNSQRKKLLPHQFQRLFGNVFGSAAGAFISRETWDACFDPELKPLGPGSTDLVHLGLDCGLRRDSAVLTACTKTGENSYALAHFRQWLPGRGKKEEIELSNIYDYLLNLNTSFNVSGVWFDPRFLHSIAQRLRRKGINMIEISPQSSSVSRCYEFLYQTTKANKFSHYGEPILTTHIMNASAVDGPSGIMLQKTGGRSKKIDGAVALSLALWGASQGGDKKIELIRGEPLPESAQIQVPTRSDWVGQVPSMRR